MTHEKLSTRMLSLAMSVAMVATMLTATAYANDGGTDTDAGAASKCHLAHDANCDYREAAAEVAAVAGTPCDKACVGEHTAACAYKAAVAAVPAVEGVACTHSCELCKPSDGGEANEQPAVGQPSYDEVVALFTALPDASVITAETTEEDKDSIFAQLTAAMGALEALTEDEQNLFLTDYLELYRSAVALNGAITGATPATMALATWDDLQAALDAGGDIVLAGDITVTGDVALRVLVDTTVTLDLNGHTITQTAEKNVITVEGTLTLKGTGGGSITRGNNNGSGGGVIVARGGTFTMEGGSITGNKASGDGGGVNVAIGSSFIMKGGTIDGNNANRGGGVNVEDDTTFTMTGGLVTNNNASEGYGSGVCKFGDEPIELGGTARITGNTVNGVPDNLYLNIESSIKQSVTPFGAGAAIGLNYYDGSPYQFTKDGKDWGASARYFTADIGSQDIECDTNKQLLLVDVPSVTFDTSNNIRRHYAAKIGNDGKVAMPADPTWDDYTFNGWYTEKDGAGAQVTTGTIFSADEIITVYAKWVKGGKTVRTTALDLTGMRATDKLATEGWKWEPSTATLTLNNMTMHLRKDTTALTTPSGTTTLKLNGANALVAPDTGIMASGSLTIEGDGSLEATGSVAGIGANGVLAINGGNVTASGVFAMAGGLGFTVGDGATIMGSRTVDGALEPAIVDTGAVLPTIVLSSDPAAVARRASISFTPAGTGGGASGGNPEYDFWMATKKALLGAGIGDVVQVDAKGHDQLPESLMAVLRSSNSASLVIAWDGGKTITLPAGKAPGVEVGRIYWPLALLAERYGAASGTIVNPETGGEPASPYPTAVGARAIATVPDATAAHGTGPIAIAACAMLLATIGGAWVLLGRRGRQDNE